MFRFILKGYFSSLDPYKKEQYNGFYSNTYSYFVLPIVDIS